MSLLSCKIEQKVKRRNLLRDGIQYCFLSICLLPAESSVGLLVNHQLTVVTSKSGAAATSKPGKTSLKGRSHENEV